MPVRSFNLKLVVPRSPAGRELRVALWTTHAEVNAATRYYEERLLLLRACPYEILSNATNAVERKTISLAEAEGASLGMARAAQALNIEHAGQTSTGAGSDNEILAVLRDLYRLLAPDETGEGSAQAANAYLSPLTDPHSRGFAAAAGKLDRPRPNWLEMTGDESELLSAANAWLASDASSAWRLDTGSPAGWLRAARARKPDWPVQFRAKLQDLAARSTSGPEAVVLRLRSLGLLPLFAPYFTPRMAKVSGGVTPWDRLAFRLAISHLLSWEAWCRRAVELHMTRKTKLDEYRARAVTAKVEALLPCVRSYEKARSAELSGLGLSPSSYVLQPRHLRGWADLREEWCKSTSQTSEALSALAATQRTRKRGRFGDPHLFLWLAEAAQHPLWRAEADTISIAATINAMQTFVERSRKTAIMTLPDGRLHPRSVQWAAEGDSNLRPYRLLDAGGGALAARLSLLASNDIGLFDDVDATLPLAASGQVHVQRLGKRGKKAEIAFSNGVGETFTAVIGSADMLFDRRHLSRRDLAKLEGGAVGSIWLKVSLDLDPVLPKEWHLDHARFVRHFAAALGKPTKAQGAVREGARVLAVDLGLRTYAACSVFELRAEAPAKVGTLTFRVPIGDRTLWATHERSFHLDLPGEEPSKEGIHWRQLRDEEMRIIRQALSRYRRVMQMADVPPQDRPAALENLAEARTEGDPYPFEETIHLALAGQVEALQPVWATAVATALADLRRSMNPVVRDWRNRGRQRLSFVGTGKSVWGIQHLSNLRRTLMSWSFLSRRTGEVRRLGRAAWGTFGSKLLTHVDNMKDDRLQTGADLIVRAAMGYGRDAAGRWVRRYPPCDAVLFEDMSRYRMRTDRPRRENSQLMRWAHRTVPNEVLMQGAVYALEVIETGAAFSSRYHARTGTPGVRCQPLYAGDFSNSWLRESLAENGIDLATCRPGDLVPRNGGKIFVCLKASDGAPLRIDVNINAAQNFQRRFWTRHAEAFRLPCALGRLDDVEVWVPRAMGKRLLGALGSTGVLRPTGHEMGSCRWESVRAQRLKGLLDTQDDAEAVFIDSEAEELAGLIEEADAMAGKVEVFFRDPSGVVLPADLWFPAKVFWRVVKSKTLMALRQGLGDDHQKYYNINPF